MKSARLPALFLLSTGLLATPAQAQESDHDHNHAHHEEAQNILLTRIKTELLGPKGEITVGFLAALGPPGCKAEPEIVKTRPTSTDKKDIGEIYRHLLLHGYKPQQVTEACHEGQKLWLQHHKAQPESPPQNSL